MARLKQPQWEMMLIDGIGECEVMYERYLDMHRYQMRKDGVRVMGEADYDLSKALDDATIKLRKKLHLSEPQSFTNKNEKSFKKFNKKRHPFKKS